MNENRNKIDAIDQNYRVILHLTVQFKNTKH